MTDLRELLDPHIIGLMKGAMQRRRARVAQSVLSPEPKTGEEAMRMVLRAQALDYVLASIEQDPVAFFEEE